MPLAKSAAPVSVNPNTETSIVSWTADGTKKTVGFVATGDYPAEYRYYEDATRIFTYKTTPEDMTAFVVDKEWSPAAAVVVAVRVIHQGPDAGDYFGTILGG